MQNENNSMFVNAVATGLEEMVDMILGNTADEVKAYQEALVRELREIELPDYPGCESYPIKARKKKANSWTVEGHKRFLNGLKTYAKGDWRSISRMAVVTRTATQVASHAQKFFLRHKEGNDNNKTKKKRSSIHDITTADA
ncbi:transcription factor DIVARICATA-like [Bidens hawaiensis]|uniref:transcription factor DIVARICATA-like n=1 Tax=Bidens hawaiensis TaxID=980011 RepID=UPI004049C7DE